MKNIKIAELILARREKKVKQLSTSLTMMTNIYSGKNENKVTKYLLNKILPTL